MMIIGCGGGLIEDLWLFNEEKVVWVIYAVIILIILLVGYEIDVIIVDMVVDVCAVMLMAAVELVVLVLNEELLRISEWCSCLE